MATAITSIFLQIFLIIFLNTAFLAYKAGRFHIEGLDCLVVIVNIILISAVLTTILAAKKIQEIALREALFEESSKKLEALQELYVTILSNRHDFLNHVTSLYGFLKTGDFPAAQQYMETFYKDIKQNNMIINLGIPALSRLLYPKQHMPGKGE